MDTRRPSGALQARDTSSGGPLGWVGAQAPLQGVLCAMGGDRPPAPRVGVDAHSLSITRRECR